MLLQAPTQPINAQWVGAFDDSAPMSCLVPWPRYPYNTEQVHHPVPELAEWYEAKWPRRGLYQNGGACDFRKRFKFAPNAEANE